jgi:hypothetical protein
LKKEEVEGEEECAQGGELKWEQAELGDSALVVSENKMGVIIKPYGRKFHLKFVDGTEKTYDASELKFFGDIDDFDRGGYMAKGGMMAKGGKVSFADKVASVKKSLLERKKVSPKVQKDYGKTYSPAEAEESAKRIVGAMTAKEKFLSKFNKKKSKK